MSLVAYAASSDEDLDYSDEEVSTSKTKTNGGTELVKPVVNGSLETGAISDDEDDYAPTEYATIPNSKMTQSLLLPQPKNVVEVKALEEELEVTPIFAKLPLPKHTVEKNAIIEEEDDEFLHKKAVVPVEEVKPKPVQVAPNKGPVKITIPSLKDFSDVDKDMASKVKNKQMPDGQKKSSLLSMLPQAKSEQNFAKVTTSNISNNTTPQLQKPSSVTKNPFIPDAVKTRRPAYNTENVDGIRKPTKRNKPTEKAKISLDNCSDSDDSGDEPGDFFSLNSEDKLPEVSMNEINAMVAERAVKMANATTKFLKEIEENKQTEEENMEVENERRLAEKRTQQLLDNSALQALAGSSSKRRRREDIQIVDISSAEVLPSREEWMRTALASSTAYQPTGVLVDEEPVAGTRRKHQITYLAHKAKANEAELQAMWSANRQTRKATQSKYGF
uniref:Proline-rich protein PRCC n=1 Tax=Zeugodacus cucurbitae TaxID=28588 RepID=A0A0A1XBS0_ZEUCU